MSTNAGIRSVLDCLLNRGIGSREETHWFDGVPHDTLIRTLLDYLNTHRHFLGYCQIDDRQALNDRGVDVVLSASGFKAGFQIKSHFDVTEKEFSANVKRQFAEALSHGLDHYYLLVCSALTGGKPNLEMRVHHVLNEIDLYKNVNFETFGPLNTVRIFNKPPKVSREELLVRKAIDDDCLHEHERGYEHLPEVSSDEIRKAQERLARLGDDWSDSSEALDDFRALEVLIQKEQAAQFSVMFAPTLPPDVRTQRAGLVSSILNTLARCRASISWDNRSELKLPSWLDHVPEEMIPYTSIQNLLRLDESVRELLRRHREMDADKPG